MRTPSRRHGVVIMLALVAALVGLDLASAGSGRDAGAPTEPAVTANKATRARPAPPGVVAPMPAPVSVVAAPQDGLSRGVYALVFGTFLAAMLAFLLVRSRDDDPSGYALRHVSDGSPA